MIQMMLSLAMEVFLLIKPFLLQYMAEFLEFFEKGSKVQKEISQTLEKYIKELYATQSKIGQNALIQSKFFEQAIIILQDTIEDMGIEREQKDNEIESLENRIGLLDSKVNEEMIKLGLNKTSSERKSDRIMDRLNISPNNHKYIKNKTTIKLKLLNKSFALIMTCLEKEIQKNYLFVTYFCIQSHLSLLKNGIHKL